MELGYVGLGAMGGALARRLMLSHKLRVLDLRPEVVAKFTENGATPSQDGASLARESDIVLLCLPRSSDVRDAIFGSGGLAEGLTPGKIVIDQTSGNPDETREMAAKLVEKGITLIDAPVSGGPAGADAGTIAIMVGGPKEAFEKVCPYLESISPNIIHCGDIGNGHVVKLVNNTIGACNRIGMLEAVAMGRKYGLSLEVMSDVINKSSGRSGATERLLPAMIAGEESSNFALGLMLKDVSLATQLGLNCGAPMFLHNVVRGLLQQGAYKYGADVNLDEMVLVLEEMADTKFVE
ncbi:MAG: 2-(hydroxymethyl)glutarate dehydrogenase [Alphaproteobacteria bacterium MarineAlpha4_Bin2]|nr:MAG: 2-(hydroxymethyl)glutarate dehydrogenase [Alphaproteobacteria bacterium MarineAlpha4_Bin2]